MLGSMIIIYGKEQFSISGMDQLVLFFNHHSPMQRRNTKSFRQRKIPCIPPKQTKKELASNTHSYPPRQHIFLIRKRVSSMAEKNKENKLSCDRVVEEASLPKPKQAPVLAENRMMENREHQQHNSNSGGKLRRKRIVTGCKITSNKQWTQIQTFPFSTNEAMAQKVGISVLKKKKKKQQMQNRKNMNNSSVYGFRQNHCESILLTDPHKSHKKVQFMVRPSKMQEQEELPEKQTDNFIRKSNPCKIRNSLQSDNEQESYNIGTRQSVSLRNKSKKRKINQCKIRRINWGGGAKNIFNPMVSMISHQQKHEQPLDSLKELFMQMM